MVCEYECQHTEVTAGTPVRGKLLRYEPTPTHHTPVYENTTTYTCDVCRETVKTEMGTENGTVEGHVFVGGVCNVCDYECGHAWDEGVETGSTPTGNYNADDASHTPILLVHKQYTCTICGKTMNEGESVNGEPEAHTYVDGVCTVCKHECQHTGAEVSEDSEVKEYINKTDETHTAVNTVTTTTTCKYCGDVSESSKDVNGEPEVHIYVDGKCTACEYECTHSKETAGEPVLGEVIAYTFDDAQHTPIYKTETTYTCDTCGETRIEEGEQAGQGEAHTYENGVCTVCKHECEHTDADVSVESKVKEYINKTD